MGKTLLAPLALTALLLCSACTDTPTTTRHAAMVASPTAANPQQTAPVSWEQAVAATTTVRVNNTSLIFMR